MSDVVGSVQDTKGNFDWLAIVGQVIDLPAGSAPDRIWAESTMVVDVLSRQVGEPSDAGEHAS